MQTNEDVLDNEEIPEYRPDNTGAEPIVDDAGSVEDQARALGWKPEAEFKGDAAKWTDADAFLEVHGRNNGALRSAVDRQAKELADLKKQMQGMDAAHKRIFDMQIKKQREEFDQQVAFLKAQRREALREGQHDTALDIEDQIDDLQKKGPELPDAPQKTQVPQQNWQENPVMVEWATRNVWFAKDRAMTVYAADVGAEVRKDNPNMAFPDLLAEVSKQVRAEFPHKFTAARRSPVEGGTPGATSAAAGAKTYASMPKAAKEACDEAVADGMKQADWVALYYGYDDRRRK
jgi:hypothetical protein